MARVAGVLLALVSGATLGCTSEQEAPLEERNVAAVHAPAQRIVSLSRMASALLVELGCAERVVGVDAASAQLRGLAVARVVPTDSPDLRAHVEELAPDLLVLAEAQAELARGLRRADREVVVAAAHDFDDGYALWRELGALVGLGPLMHDTIRERTRALARLGAESYGQPRPRVAAIASLEPFAIAGGHHFVTDLIEQAGAENVAHGREERTIGLAPGELRALEPALLIYASAAAIDERQRTALTTAAGDIAPIAFVVFDRDLFFRDETIESVRTIREHVRRIDDESSPRVTR